MKNTKKYMSLTEIAQWLGITKGALAQYKLPEPDAFIGKTRGWKLSTVEKWNSTRPGRGIGGGRPRKNQHK